jgi:cytochrome c
MNAFELNKIAGAVLSALLVIFGSRTLLDIALKEDKPEKPGWTLPISKPAPSESKSQAKKGFDARHVVGLIPNANAEAGKETFRRCQQCHTVEKGGRNLVGPNLWDIVGRKVGEQSGFAYSPALAQHAGNWTFEELARYLHDPKAAIPGNKMAFPGVKDDAELADLLAYLRTLSDTPAPVPD